MFAHKSTSVAVLSYTGTTNFDIELLADELFESLSIKTEKVEKDEGESHITLDAGATRITLAKVADDTHAERVALSVGPTPKGTGDAAFDDEKGFLAGLVQLVLMVYPGAQVTRMTQPGYVDPTDPVYMQPFTAGQTTAGQTTPAPSTTPVRPRRATLDAARPRTARPAQRVRPVRKTLVADAPRTARPAPKPGNWDIFPKSDKAWTAEATVLRDAVTPTAEEMAPVATSIAARQGPAMAAAAAFLICALPAGALAMALTVIGRDTFGFAGRLVGAIALAFVVSQITVEGPVMASAF